VCVVQQKRNGNVFNRDFKLPSLTAGDRVVAQLVVTGHGWAATTEQCGEYCHAAYALTLNGVSAANVSQFREDCKANPIGEGKQYGTWEFSRNGWCPGSVMPGLYMDLTEWVTSGQNHLSFDVSVWSDVMERYEPYTDMAGFAFGDRASLSVGLTLFVYGGEAVEAVRQQPKALSAAEAALRSGLSSEPEGGSLTIPRRGLDAGLLQQQTTAAKVMLWHPEKHAKSSQTFDFEAGAPWYSYNASRQGSPGGGGTIVVNIFNHRLVQINTRTVQATIPRHAIPDDWSQAALHFRLSRPDGLEYDHWDRQGSFGMLLGGGDKQPKSDEESSPSLLLRPESQQSKSRHWPMMSSPNRFGAFSASGQRH
jgi:hypothetical protein